MARRAEELDLHERADPHARTPRVLIAEDDDDFLRLLALFLKRDGYRVTCVSSADGLLADLAAASDGAEPPALVITDNRMPGGTGLQALQRIRDGGWLLPLVLITAFGSEEVAQRAARLGVTLMTKPFDMDDLRTLVGLLAPTHRTDTSGACAACGGHDDPSCGADTRGASLCRECRALLRDPSGAAR